MSRIILIETSTSLCTTALAEEGKISISRRSDTPKAQAAMTAPFVKDMLDERGLTVKDCDAVCVSAGPGSYTGLRVGVSTAKGLCFAAGIPLISVGTLELLAHQAIDERLLPDGCKYVIPMIDARRMEVYTAVFALESAGAATGDAGSNVPGMGAACPGNPATRMAVRQVTEVEPKIVEAGSFAKELAEGPVLFIGDGAAKCCEVLACPNAHFVQTNPTAEAMLTPAMERLSAGRFEDTAYFEPFYLKQFVATVSKKNVL